jgi:hypothetical protein
MRSFRAEQNRTCWFLVAFGLLTAAQRGMGQNLGESSRSTMLGLNLGYSYGVPIAVDREPGVINPNFADLTGLSSDHTLSIGLQYNRFKGLGTEPLTRSLGLWGTFSAGISVGSFLSDQFQGDTVLDPSSLQVVVPHHQIEVTSRPLLVQLAAGVDYALLGHVRFGLGWWMQYRLSSNFSATESLVDYPDVLFHPEESRSRDIGVGAKLGSAPLRTGPIVMLSTPIDIASNVSLMPTVGATLDLGALGTGLGVRSLRATGGMSILFSAGAPGDLADNLPTDTAQPVALLPDTARVDTARVDTSARAVPRLAATIALHAEGGPDSTAVEVRERSTHYRQITPMIPVLYFEEGSAALSERYSRLTVSQAKAFTRYSLARFDPSGVYYQILNVLGHRLRSYPSARIILSGSVSSGEPVSLATERAAAVRDYLHRIWGIDVGRMTLRIARQVVGREDALRRAVSIASRTASILAPVETEWIVERMELPPIHLSEQVESEAGLRRWRLTLSHSGTDVGSYEGTSEEQLRTLALSFSLPKKTINVPVTADLLIEDSTGGTVRASAQLRLTRERASTGASPLTPSAGAHRMIATITVPSASVDPLASAALLREAAAVVGNGATVTVTPNAPADVQEGVAGATGDSLHVASIIEKLTRMVMSRNVSPRSIVAEAAPRSGREIDGPERRALLSGVRIVIESGDID